MQISSTLPRFSFRFLLHSISPIFQKVALSESHLASVDLLSLNYFIPLLHDSNPLRMSLKNQPPRTLSNILIIQEVQNSQHEAFSARRIPTLSIAKN